MITASGAITPFNVNTQLWSSTAAATIDSFPNTLAAGEAGKIARIIDMMVTSGNWDSVKTLAGFFLTDPINALWDWKRLETYTNVSASVHTANQGYLFDGTADYINTNFIPSTDGLLQDDSHVEAYCYENLSSATNDYLFGAIDGTEKLNIYQQTNPRVNADVNSTVTTVGPLELIQNTTRYGAHRDNSATQEVFKNGTQSTSTAVVSTGLPTIPLFVGATNSAGTAIRHLNSTISLFIAGTTFDLTQLKIELDLMENLFIV